MLNRSTKVPPGAAATPRLHKADLHMLAVFMTVLVVLVGMRDHDTEQAVIGLAEARHLGQ